MFPTLVIDDAEDPRVAPYTALRERDAVGRRDGFVVEGEVVLTKAISAGRHPLASVLLAHAKVGRLSPVLAELAADVPVYSARQDVLDEICGFPLHRGVLALGRRPHLPGADALLAGLGADAVVVCLLGLGDAENVGAVFRNAAAFGADAVLLDAACCDPLYRRAIRVSVGAALITPFARLNRADDPLALLERHGFEQFALSPSGKLALTELKPGGRTALLFGSEGPGLPAAVLASTRTVRIPMHGGFDSLNVATASGVVLHHVMAGRPRPC